MMNRFTKEYITKKAKDNDTVIVLSDCELLLDSYCKLVEKYGYKLEFKKKIGMIYTNLSANAGFFKNSNLIASPEWAFQLIVDNKRADLAFKITIGHELAHKEKENICFLHLFNFKFCAWVNEIYADFRSVEKMFNSNKNVLINAINYKLEYKKEYCQGDIEDYTHPSWARRKYYVENFNFDSELIYQIARDTFCTNDKLIKKICNYYQEIILI